MEVVNEVLPNKEQIEGFLERETPAPIYMLNLLKFKDRAEYEDGRETNLTGEQAYELYAVEVTKLLQKVGGEAVFHAEVERLMLGEVEELWDAVAIAMYPSRQAMFEMMQMPEMHEIGVHRSAGLAGQLNIETVDAVGSWLGKAWKPAGQP